MTYRHVRPNHKPTWARLKARALSGPYSWDAELPNGALLLNIWEDRRTADNRQIVLRERGDDERNTAMYKKRQENLKQIGSGVPAYGLVVAAVDTAAMPRTVHHVVSQLLYEIFDVRETAPGEWTAKLGEGVLIDEFMQQLSVSANT